MNEQEFAQRLRQYRKDKGMTQQELADLLGTVSGTGMLERVLTRLIQGYWDGSLVLELLLYVLIWAALTLGLSALTVALAKGLAREPKAGGALPAFSKDDLPPLRLGRAQFHWTKALPALAPWF